MRNLMYDRLLSVKPDEIEIVMEDGSWYTAMDVRIENDIVLVSCESWDGLIRPAKDHGLEVVATFIHEGDMDLLNVAEPVKHVLAFKTVR